MTARLKGKNVLILCEKPSAVQRVAKALDEKSKPQKKEINRVPYYEANRDERRLIVVPALGHLYTVAPKIRNRDIYPVFDFEWVPKYKAERNAQKTRIWIEVISKLSEKAEEYVLATDYDVEGATLGYTILKYACGDKEKKAKRMKFSTLTDEELKESFYNRSDHIEFSKVEAGTCRHFLDAMYGINLSRAMTNAAKSWSGKYVVLSTGRVQGPTLKFLVDREMEINSFAPTPYWSIKARVELGGSTYEVDYECDIIERRDEATAIVNECKGKKGKITGIEVWESRQNPPVPFNLGGLQTEAYSLFKYFPRQTADIAERLYLKALISYPRTSSNILPPIINYRAILESLSLESKYRILTDKLLSQRNLVPKKGKKYDAAHPAIYPTGNLPESKSSNPERRIWDLIVRRFMAVFGKPALKQNMKISITVNEYRFYLRGRQILNKGWTIFYEPFTRVEEIILPIFKEGQEVKFKAITLEDRFTKPPPRYNPGSLLKKMEDTGIGTKATRAGIIDTLYNRGYVSGERVTVSELGLDLVDILNRYCPEVISVDFTRELEVSMEEIQNSREKMENVLNKAVDRLKPILEEIKKHQKSVGRELSRAIRKVRIQQRVVGDCPKCGMGRLMTLYSRRTGKRFIGCTSFFKGACKASFPLPQKGTVKPTRKTCRTCGWPIIKFKTKSKPLWTFCVNTECPSKRKRNG